MSQQADQIYQSFLVRCWLVPAATTDEPPSWRFELREISAESQKRLFSDLEQLKEFISTELMGLAAGRKQPTEDEDKRKGGKP